MAGLKGACHVPRVLSLLAAAVLLLGALPAYSDSASDDTGLPQAVQVETSAWDDWFRDANGNRVDDVIEGFDEDHVFGVFLTMDHRPTQEEIEHIGKLGLQVRFQYEYLDCLCVRGLNRWRAFELAAMPGVEMVEYEPLIIPHLDISARAIQARDSGTYSPETARDLGFTGYGANIAIIDSGVDDGWNTLLGHESLNDFDDYPLTFDEKFVAGLDATALIIDESGGTNPQDTNGHGTHCAGIALGTGGRGADSVYMGVAPGAGLIDVKVVGATGGAVDAWGNVVFALEWLAGHKEQFNVRVASMSLGSDVQSDGTDTVSQAVNLASASGIACVSSTGNDGLKFIGYPAAADSCIAVGACNDYNTISRTDDSMMWWSNRGPRLNDGDGDELDELKPDVVAPGEAIYSAMRGTRGTYVEMSGTSMSCPHVAGVVALMLEANPSLTPDLVKSVLRDTAEHRGDPYDPDVDEYYDQRWGWGIVNAHGAVVSAMSPRIHVEPESFELSVLAGQSAQEVLAVGNTGAQLLDYYITTATASESFFHEDFSSFPDSWSITSNQGNAWYYDGNNDFMYNTYGYPNAGYLDTPIIDCSDRNGMTLSFYHMWLSGYPGGEQDGYVRGSIDGGLTFPYLIDEFHDLDPEVEDAVKEYHIPWADGEMHVVIRFDIYNYDDWYWFIDDFDLSAMQEGTVDWLSMFPGEGVVYPFELAEEDVTFDAQYLVPGEYCANIVVSSNDLSNPVVPIPVTLHVLSNPHDMMVSTITAEGEFEGGYPMYVNGTVVNIGLQPENNVVVRLLIDGVEANSTAIDHIEPYEPALVSFNWTPPENIVYEVAICAVPVPGETSTANNNQTRNVTIAAKPHIKLEPEEMTVLLLEDTTTTRPLTVRNTGEAELEFSISLPPSEPIIYSQDFTESPPDWTITHVGGTGWIWDSNGEQMVNYYGYPNAGYLDSPVMDCSGRTGVTLSFWHYWRANWAYGQQDGYVRGSIDGGETFPYLIDDFHHLDPAEEDAVKTYQIPWADGEMQVVIRFDIYNYDDWYWFIDDFELLADAGEIADWLSYAPESGAVDPLSSIEVELGFDATGLGLGTYTANLIVESNDEHNRLANYPVTLIVTDYDGTVHNIDQDRLYLSIQEAVDEANPGEHLIVNNGTFFENVTVEKTLDIRGWDRDTTIVNGLGAERVFHLKYADWINITGLTITNGNYGILNGWSSHTNTSDLRIEYVTEGIHVSWADECTVSRNIIENCNTGVWLQGKAGNFTITENKLAHCNNYALICWEPGYNMIANNSFDENTQGLMLAYGSDHNVVRDNIFSANEGHGVVILHNITDQNLIHHNSFIDSPGWQSSSGENHWDDGYPSGGNYWSNYTGVDIYKGPMQNIPGSDGIGDTQYNGVGLVDHYPFMVPFHRVENLDKGTYYKKIQAAVDDADPGDHILVNNGTFYENVDIGRPITLSGAVKERVILEGQGADDSVGIHVNGSFYVGIEGVTIKNYTRGVLADQGFPNSRISRVDFVNNSLGLDVEGWSYQGVVEECRFIDNGDGLVMRGGGGDDTIHATLVRECLALNNTGTGFYVRGGEGLTITECEALGNTRGFVLSNDTHQTVLTYCNASHNDIGIYLNSTTCTDNDVRYDQVYANEMGVRVEGAGNRIAWNNIMGNTEQATDEQANQWDMGYEEGGNYWSHWTTPDDLSGEFQDQPGSDGYVDMVYLVSGSGGSMDNYPYTTYYGWYKPVHNVDKDEHYAGIQMCIDNADPGNTIIVNNFTYFENVYITIPLTLAGWDREDVVIDCKGSGVGITISSDWVNVSGFTIRNYGNSFYDAGVKIDYSDNCRVDDVEVFKEDQTNPGSSGIKLDHSHYNEVSNCSVRGYSGNTIELEESCHNTIERNQLESDSENGLYLYWASENLVRYNNIRGCTNGVSLYGDADCNLVELNHVYENVIGVRGANYPDGNQIWGNNIYDNYQYGLYFTSSANGNSVYHNNIHDNQVNAFDCCGNIWNLTYPYGGNWWGDWTAPDADDNGYVDSEYAITGGSNRDQSPFVDPYDPYAMYLYPCMNLVSLPLVPYNGHIDYALNSIAGYYTSVQWYDASSQTWLHWNRYKECSGFENPLQQLSHTMGLYIDVTRVMPFYPSGQEPTSSNNDIWLYPGWNLVGFPSTAGPVQIADTLSGRNVLAVETLDVVTGEISRLDMESDSLEKGPGYWIYVDGEYDQYWDVP